MKYKAPKEWNDMDFGGSGLVGTIKVPREVLLAKLGMPTQVNSERIVERWLIKFESGTVATIFNDKQCKENEWCVGGFGKTNKQKENLSLKAVRELFNV